VIDSGKSRSSLPLLAARAPPVKEDRECTSILPTRRHKRMAGSVRLPGEVKIMGDEQEYTLTIYHNGVQL